MVNVKVNIPYMEHLGPSFPYHPRLSIPPNLHAFSATIKALSKRWQLGSFAWKTKKNKGVNTLSSFTYQIET